jgi:hypothetical protein
LAKIVECGEKISIMNNRRGEKKRRTHDGEKEP